MTRNEAGSRFSTMTGSSTDSARSSITVKPLPSTPTSATLASTPSSVSSSAFALSHATTNDTHATTTRSASQSSRRTVPSRLKTDENGTITRYLSKSFDPQLQSQFQTSPTSATDSRLALSPSSSASNASVREPRMSEQFVGYRRDLAVLDNGGGSRSSQRHENHNSLSSFSHIAPFLTANGGATSGTGVSTSFYNDSSDNLSAASPLSPGLRALVSRPSQGSIESPDFQYITDERRPSVASITTTASSQGSKASGARGGYRKLQGFFGEEFPGDPKQSSETSLINPGPGKEHRSQSHSYSRTQRDRNYSNATDHGRDSSPAPSRPRTPVPAPEVVPFLYQDAGDIRVFGEAPVRNTLSGPDRERFTTESSQYPPKTSSSGRSAHSIVHLPGHHHRHNKSNEDPRALRPSVSREDSSASFIKDRTGSTAMNSSKSRAQSPAPNGNGALRLSKTGTNEAQASPGHHHPKKGTHFLQRFRGRNKEKDEGSDLKRLPGSSQSLQAPYARNDSVHSRHDQISPYSSTFPVQQGNREVTASRPAYPRQGPSFSKIPFSGKGRTNRHHDDLDEHIGPLDPASGGTAFYLDTNLDNMEGILSRPLPLTPMETDFPIQPEPERQLSQPGPNGAWNAPDSWAVKRDDEPDTRTTEPDDIGGPPRSDETEPYYIRFYKSDNTFSTLQIPVVTLTAEALTQLIKKNHLPDVADNYHILIRKHGLFRILSQNDRPALLQKRLLQAIGYEERDKLAEIGREDTGYLCRFLFLSNREIPEGQLPKLQKYNHVDLAARNLITIPVPLYSKASDIISLNLSRNLSLDLPRDFISSCTNLRDIKYNNNEARKLPPSLGEARRLTYLDVSNNRLDQLDSAGLDNLNGLLKLNLANNRLKAFPAYFGQYKSLRTLNVSSNYIDQFPSFVCDLECLVDLDLSFNNINTIPESIGNLRALEKFVITNNRLSGPLPQNLRNLSNLRELDIRYNTITTIDVISELPRLEILAADHNSISQFVGTFQRIRSLKLNSNPITKFELREPVPTLKILNLSTAQLASIDESFNNMLNLERLILDRNYFVSLPNQIGNLKRLEHFSIANNSIGELPPEIGCLQELRELDVHGNNIRKLPMEIWWACNLVTLNASSNILDTFPKPSSRQPQSPGEVGNSPGLANGKGAPVGPVSRTPSVDDLHGDTSRRPSQASTSLLNAISVTPNGEDSDRKASVVSVYGKGRKTSVVSRSTAASSTGIATPTSGPRKDSSRSARFDGTFASSLRNLYLADNQLDDDVFDQLVFLKELRILNLSYNGLSDMPQRSIRNWPQLAELYLSGNDLTNLPADDLEDRTLLQILHINGNKFTNLPADIGRAKKLAVLDCGNNYLKYNINNIPYDWNWNLNPELRYLNLSGNKRLEIKRGEAATAASRAQPLSDFMRLVNLRVLGLMDVTLTEPGIPDQSEDRRVRTSGSMAGYMPYGMADTLGKNEHLSTIDLVVPRYNGTEHETLLGLFDGQALSSGGSKIAKFLHENFGRIFPSELKSLKKNQGETEGDALRRTFLTLNKELLAAASQHDEKALTAHRPSQSSIALSKEDINSGGVATIAYLKELELYVGNVGDVQAMLIQTDGGHKMLTKKHDPADPHERHRIREAGGWVSRTGRLNDVLEVSRAFGYADLMPAVQAAPHVSHVSIRDVDDILIFGTRELWEYLTPGLVVDVAREMRADLMLAAQKLRDLAMAYGSTGKIMVMMISVADLKRRSERARLGGAHRGHTLSVYQPLQDESGFPITARRPKKTRGDGPLDSTLQRLEAEVPAPTGNISIVFTDIKNSTQLWETYPDAMRTAIKLHNETMRRHLRRIGGFEVKTEGDAFMVSFPTATSAMLWCFSVQTQLLSIDWPPDILNSVNCQPIFDRDNKLIFKGLSVRMGIHWGEPLAEPDPVTRRMDYYGPMVNKASRISAVADGGQIAVSADFISEIQRCLESYNENTIGDEDGYEDENLARAIRADLKTLSSQGFEVRDLGERKLKGLENSENVYSLYPHALVGRIDQHTAHETAQNAQQTIQADGTVVVEKPATLAPESTLKDFDPEFIWSLWRVSLRLEMLCSTLEDPTGRGLQTPETELLERMKQRGGEVTESFLFKFMEHQVSRIETCINTLSIRHLAMGQGPIRQLNDLRAPMTDVLLNLTAQLAELQAYKDRYGSLQQGRPARRRPQTPSDDGSETEQEW